MHRYPLCMKTDNKTEISLFHFFSYFLTTDRNFHREILSRLNEFSPKLLHTLFRETFPAILVLVVPEYNQQNAIVSGVYLSSSVSLVMAKFHVKPKPNLTYNFLILLLHQLSIFSLYYLETKNKIISDRSKVTIKHNVNLLLIMLVNSCFSWKTSITKIDGQQVCKCMETKVSVYLRKDFNPRWDNYIAAVSLFWWV